MIYHITKKSEWELAQQAGVYLTDSFKTEGFIHCSTAAQVLRVAGLLYPDEKNLVLLAIIEAELESELLYENTEGGDELFPHLHGPLSLSAVTAAVAFPPLADGSYEWPSGLERI